MSFLLNMFGKGHRQEQGKYDRITFKINLSDHIPQYYQTSSNKPLSDAQMTPEHPLYYQIFPRKQGQIKNQNYIQYIVKQNDTMSGLAIRLDVSQQFLRNINGISGSLYPGMTIQLPKDTDLTKLQQIQKQQQHQRLRISQLLNADKPVNNINYKYTVYYFAGPSGDIKGILTVNNNYIIFNPLLEDQYNLTKFTIQKLLKFNVLVQVSDIQKADSLRLPYIDQTQDKQQPRFNNIVQFMLYKVGNQKIQRKYKQRLRQLKINHKAIASISFSFHVQDQQTSQQQCKQVTQTINNIIQSTKDNQPQDDNKKRLTNIPFFDIISDKSKSTDVSLQDNNKLGKGIVLGSLTQQSDIITPGHFQRLVKNFPLLYKLYNWQKAFSTRRDGSAFNTFLSKSKDIQPAILLIKQYKGNILGAFLVDCLQPGKTGRGQMFIFTFRNDVLDPQVFHWTTKNDFFVYFQKDQGIGIGMGVKYGIFVNRNFQKGSSAATNTFGNKDSLSAKEDFLIDDIQLWGPDSNF